MNEFIAVIIIVILVLCFFIHYESQYSELTYVVSSIDGESYLVRNREDKQRACDLLATIKKNLNSIVKYLEKNNISDPKVKRLVSKYRPQNISESIPNTNYTSYSVNKGEKIVFCIREKKTHELVDINTMMFVAIHELAHVMTKSIGHTEEFWDNMRYLLKKGIKLGIYKEENYKDNPKPYCGTQITDSPL
uniref:WLM domain-containing protein n=1 Tax=viral metagenome TaxID=1070528 RepID=A0A6C0JCN7_9ZZZZ